MEMGKTMSTGGIDVIKDPYQKSTTDIHSLPGEVSNSNYFNLSSVVITQLEIEPVYTQVQNMVVVK